VVFVPQNCGGRLCNSHDNTTHLNKLNTAALAINLITLGTVFCSCCCFAYRGAQLCMSRIKLPPDAFPDIPEYCIIQEFDFDEDLPLDNLAEEIEAYPSVDERLRKNNFLCYALSIVILLLMGLNFGISAAVVLSPEYNLGKGTVTGLVSSTLLLLPRAIGWLTMSRASVVNPTQGAIYLFAKVPKAANRIDSRIRFKEGVWQKPQDFEMGPTRRKVLVAAPAESA